MSRSKPPSPIATTAAAASVGLTLTERPGDDKPALLGGVRTKGYRLAHRRRSGRKARRGGPQRTLVSRPSAERFEQDYAKLNAASTAWPSPAAPCCPVRLGALGIGPGDEVIVPPYTSWPRSTSSSALRHARIVDSDRETFMMDRANWKRPLPSRTAAIIPVHIGGSAADMDDPAIAKKRNIPVIEDACQAHMGQWAIAGYPGAPPAAQLPRARTSSGRRSHPHQRRGHGQQVLRLPQQLPHAARAATTSPMSADDPPTRMTEFQRRARPSCPSSKSGPARQRERPVSVEHVARGAGHSSAATSRLHGMPTTSTCSATTRRSSPTCRGPPWLLMPRESPAPAATALEQGGYIQNAQHVPT